MCAGSVKCSKKKPFVAMPLPKWGKEKKIAAISLLKMRGKKNCGCRNLESNLKKILRSQYFYNIFTTNHR